MHYHLSVLDKFNFELDQRQQNNPIVNCFLIDTSDQRYLANSAYHSAQQV